MDAYIILCIVIFVSVGLSKCNKPVYDNKNGRHTISMGHRKYGDMLLFHDNPTADGAWFPYPEVQHYDVCYPQVSCRPITVNITAFNVTDQMGKGKGGYAFVKSGGVGANSVCLHLKSRRGRGYSFIIDIWGIKQ